MTPFLWIWPQIPPNKSSEEGEIGCIVWRSSVRKMGRAVVMVNVGIGGLEVNDPSYSVV